MKLIVIYGVPAVGKFTVAKELSKITGFKVFHNHLSYDLVKSIIEKEDRFFWRTVRKVRLGMIRVAAEKNVDVILTTCYAGNISDMFIKPLLETVKKHGIKVYFVHLYCHPDQLMKRVKGESRKSFRKLKSSVELRKNLKEFGHDVAIPYVKSFRIDNTKLAPKKVALLIKNKFELK